MARRWIWLSVSATALALVATAAIAGGQDQQALDRWGLANLHPYIEAATGTGNLQPNFTSLTVVQRDNKGGYTTPVEEAVVQYDDRFSVLRMQFRDIRPEAPPGPLTYRLVFDGFGPNQKWTRDEKFPIALNSRISLNDGRKTTNLYVADITDTYPGFEWLGGPFSIIRQEGRSDATLSGPVGSIGPSMPRSGGSRGL
jgi:hypothetical protein